MSWVAVGVGAAGVAANAGGAALSNQNSGRARKTNAQNDIDEQKRRMFALYGWNNISSNKEGDRHFLMDRWGIDPAKLGSSYTQGAEAGLAGITSMVQRQGKWANRTFNADAAANLDALKASRTRITGQYGADTAMLAARTGEMERTAQQYGVGGENVINQTYDRALGQSYSDIGNDLTARGLGNTTIQSQQKSFAAGENAYNRSRSLDELHRARTGMVLDAQKFGTGVAADRAAGGTELDTRFALTENQQMLDTAKERLALWGDQLGRLTSARQNQVNVPLQVLTGGPSAPQVQPSGNAFANVASQAGGSLIYAATRMNQGGGQPQAQSGNPYVPDFTGYDQSQNPYYDEGR